MYRPVSLKVLAILLLCFAGAANAATTACSVTYATRNDWQSGFVVDITVANTGPAPVSNWKVKWSYPVSVALASAPWRTNVAINGGEVSAADNGVAPVIAPGSKITFGMALSYAGALKPAPAAVTVSGDNCVVAEAFYADPDSNAAIWARNHPNDPRMPDIRDNLANKAAAKWFGGWSGDIKSAVDTYVTAAAMANRTPILVAYNIPLRDCGQYSSGGAQDSEIYKNWIAAFVAGLKDRRAVVIVEPDAIPQIDCLNADARAARLAMLQFAALQFKEHAPNALVYLDAGNSGWLDPNIAADRLVRAGVAYVRGFSLNVSNYRTTDSNKTYGMAVMSRLEQLLGSGSRGFVVDTSRNGNGPYGKEWCDPPGRKTGSASTEYLGGAQPEMTLWIKPPGNADGCAGTAGSFLPDLAVKLIHGYF